MELNFEGRKGEKDEKAEKSGKGENVPSKKRSVNLYMDDELFEWVDEIARKYHRPRTWVVRLALLGELEKRTDDGYSEAQFSELIERLNELMGKIGKAQVQIERIGTNINQIARKVNQSHHTTEEEWDVLEETVKELNSLERYLNAVAGWVVKRVEIA